MKTYNIYFCRIYQSKTPAMLMFNGIFKALLDNENYNNKLLLDNFFFILISTINLY